MLSRVGWRRGAAGIAAALLVLVGIALLGRARGPEWSLAPEPVASLLAVGDTGEPPGWSGLRDGQRAVGFGLAREDRREPVDALLLLGDLFYPEGLKEEELVERVRSNLVRPYCRFVDLSGPRSAEVADACRRARPPGRPFYGVLGNHDWRTESSPRLEAKVVPEFVANWVLPDAGAAEVFALSSRVSLVLFDSMTLLKTLDATALRDALRRAPGPWRILAAHHPVGTERRESGDRAGDPAIYEALVRRAIADAGVDVHVMLAGHEHNLQLIELSGTAPHLVAIAGGGSGSLPVKSRSAGRLFAYEGLGFARVDLLREEGVERLAVTLFAAPTWRRLLGVAPRALARWSVGLDGAVRAEPPTGRRVEPS